MENLKDDTQAHPADALAIALDRANGLLGTLGQLFEPTSETFSGGNSFIAHALATTSAIVDDARTALEDLKYVCDLTLIDLPSDSDSVIEVNFQLDTEKNAAADAASEAISDKHLDETESDLPHAEEEQIAQTYLELLRKLTAAEVFAAEQQALSVPGSGTDLLPLLRSLREDIQKIQNAA
jgi:hypothetical protein